jgi:hypothetical protein
VEITNTARLAVISLVLARIKLPALAEKRLNSEKICAIIRTERREKYVPTTERTQLWGDIAHDCPQGRNNDLAVIIRRKNATTKKRLLFTFVLFLDVESRDL